MPFRFVEWKSEPGDVQLGVLSIEVLVESRLLAIVQSGRLIN